MGEAGNRREIMVFVRIDRVSNRPLIIMGGGGDSFVIFSIVLESLKYVLKKIYFTILD